VLSDVISFVKHPLSLDYILHSSVLLEMLWCLEAILLFKILFLLLWLDSQYAMHIFNQFIRPLGCLTHENWFLIDSRFLWIYSNFILNHLNRFKASMNLFILHFDSFESIQSFSESIQSSCSPNLKFALLNRFKHCLNWFKHGFSILF